MSAINTFVRVTDQYLNSPFVSLQKHHLTMFIEGQLAELEIRDWSGKSLIATYRGKELARLIASAVERGPMFSGNDTYFLGKR